MADYINRNILCQAYLHIKTPKSPEARQKLRAALQEFARTRAEFFLYTDIQIDVEFESGSLKARITVLGLFALLYHDVATYPDFRAGAIAIYEDAKRLSEFLVSEGLFETKARHEDVVRVEARTGVVGSVRKVLGDVDQIKQGNGIRGERWMAERLARLDEDTRKLLENLKTEKDRSIVRDGLRVQVEALPPSPAPRPRSPADPEYVDTYQRLRKDLLSFLDTLIS